jgi:hypothetical protein
VYTGAQTAYAERFHEALEGFDLDPQVQMALVALASSGTMAYIGECQAHSQYEPLYFEANNKNELRVGCSDGHTWLIRDQQG